MNKNREEHARLQPREEINRQMCANYLCKQKLALMLKAGGDIKRGEGE